MKHQASCLQKRIEIMRKELVELCKHKSLTDPEVIELSQKLDQVLNEYRRLK